jgi:hypothetical protein
MVNRHAGIRVLSGVTRLKYNGNAADSYSSTIQDYLESQEFVDTKEATHPAVTCAVIAILGYIFMKPMGDNMLSFYVRSYVEPVLCNWPVARYVYDVAMKMQRKGEYFTRLFVVVLILLVCRARSMGLDDRSITKKTLALVAQMEKKLLWRKRGQKGNARFEIENGFRILFLGNPNTSERSAYSSRMADIIGRSITRGCVVFLLAMETESNPGAIKMAEDLGNTYPRNLLKAQTYTSPGICEKPGSAVVRHVCIAWKSTACSLPRAFLSNL